MVHSILLTTISIIFCGQNVDVTALDPYKIFEAQHDTPKTKFVRKRIAGAVLPQPTNNRGLETFDSLW